MSCRTSSAAGRRSPIRRRAAGSWGWICAKTLRACRSSMSPPSAVSPTASPTFSPSSSGPAIDFDAIVVSGGAAQSPLVRQIIADVCGKPVEAPATAEPVLLGSAMIGAVAAGARTLASAMDVDVDASRERTEPAGGAIAAFHARKRRAHEILRQAERDIRRAALKARWPEVVIFDCDGVLVDSEVIALAVTRRLLGEAGLHLSDEETRERFLGLRLDSVLRRVESELGAPLPQGFPDDLVARDSGDVRARAQRHRRRPAGGRGLADARLRRFFERARTSELRASGHWLRDAVRAQHFFRRRGRAGKAQSRSFPVRGPRDGRRAEGLPGDRGQRRGRRRRARRRNEGVRFCRREPFLAPTTRERI